MPLRVRENIRFYKNYTPTFHQPIDIINSREKLWKLIAILNRDGLCFAGGTP